MSALPGNGDVRVNTGRGDGTRGGRRAGGVRTDDALSGGREGGRSYILGRQEVLAALRAGRPLHRIMVAEGATGAAITTATALARERGVPVQVVPRQVLAAELGSSHHQGIAAVAAARPYWTVEDLLSQEPGEPWLLVALANVQDPGNLGAVARSAEVLGAHGLLVPERRSAGLTPGAEKAAAGALEWLKVARVGNLARELGHLKERGLWVVGGEADGDLFPWQADFCVPLVLVLGGEASGLGRVVRKACDLVVKVPVVGRTSSLNVAAAASILLYEVRKQRCQAAREASGT